MQTLLLPFPKQRLDVPLDDIIRLEGARNYTKVTLTDGNEIIVSKTLKALEPFLSVHFIRIHRSYVINTRHLIKKGPTGFLYMSDGVRLKPSRRKKKEIKKALESIAPSPQNTNYYRYEQSSQPIPKLLRW